MDLFLWLKKVEHSWFCTFNWAFWVLSSADSWRKWIFVVNEGVWIIIPFVRWTLYVHPAGERRYNLQLLPLVYWVTWSVQPQCFLASFFWVGRSLPCVPVWEIWGGVAGTNESGFCLDNSKECNMKGDRPNSFIHLFSERLQGSLWDEVQRMGPCKFPTHSITLRDLVTYKKGKAAPLTSKFPPGSWNSHLWHFGSSCLIVTF